MIFKEKSAWVMCVPPILGLMYIVSVGLMRIVTRETKTPKFIYWP